ncbi:hypothetical protein MMC30_008888 [Trapelia coarctata]|nr:hypothetical protein [Trapelia coarctata]
MGICSKATQNKLIDVGGDLLSELLESAVELLVVASLEDGPTIPDTIREYFADDDEKNAAELEKDLQTLTERQFLVKYAYTYNGDRTVPTSMSTDPNAFLTSHEDFVSVPEGDTTLLTNYVDNTILGKGSNLPAWFIKQFTNDLLALLTTLIENGNPTWQYEKFDNTYTDFSGSSPPISVNAIVTYANASLRESGQSAKESILYYTGVYFNSRGFGYEKSLKKFLGGSLDPPQTNYPIVQIGIATGTLIVASALAVYIIRAAPPAAGVNFSFHGMSLQLVLFKWPWSSTFDDDTSFRQPQGRRKGITNGSSTGSRRLDVAVEGIESTWVEKLLNQLGFAYTTKPTTSDAQTTAEITLQISYARPKKNAQRMLEEEGRGGRGAFVNGKGGQALEEDTRSARGGFPNSKQIQEEDARSGRGFER